MQDTPFVPALVRARVVKIDLATVVTDFLNTHGKGEHAFSLPESAAVLRQAHLPDDATILWARLDQDDRTRTEALNAAKEWIANRTAMTISDAECRQIISQIDDAIHPDRGYSHRVAALEAAKGMIQRWGGMQPTEHERQQVVDRLNSALSAPPARYLTVAILSDEYEEVPHGQEPEMAFDHAAFAVPHETEGDKS